MGGTSGRSVSEELDARFTVVKGFPDPDITLRQDKTDKGQYLVRKAVLLREGDYKRQLDSLERKKQIVNPHVARLLEYHTSVQDMICSRHHTVYVIYEYPHRNLDQEISERFIQKRRFEEKELWSILASCILGLSALQAAQIPHQCLRSEDILLSSSGNIQVADPYCTDATTNYRKLLENRSSRQIYLAPELCELLAKEETVIPESLNPYKADVFTMGMIVLEMGLLEYQYECYRDDFTKVNQAKLAERVEKLGSLYSQDLRVMTELMLQINPQDRQLWSEMQLFVRKNEPTFVESQLVQEDNDRSPNAVSHNTVVQRPEEGNRRKQGLGSLGPDLQENIVPVLQSWPSKPPRLMGGPADNYVTRVEPDENLIELSEEETNSEFEGVNIGIPLLKTTEENTHPGLLKQGKTASKQGAPSEQTKSINIRQLKPDQSKLASMPAEPVSHSQQTLQSRLGSAIPKESSREPVHLQPRSFKSVQPSVVPSSMMVPPSTLTPRPPQSKPTDTTPALLATSYSSGAYAHEQYKPIVQSSYIPSSTYNFPSAVPSYIAPSYAPLPTYAPTATYALPPYAPPPTYVPPASSYISPSSSYSSLSWIAKPPVFSLADNKDLFTDFAKLGITRSYLPNTTYESKFVYEPALPSLPAKYAWENNSSLNYKEVESKLAPSPIQAIKEKEKDNLSSSPAVGDNDAAEISETDLSSKKQKGKYAPKTEVVSAGKKNLSQERLPAKSKSKQRLVEQEQSTQSSNPIFVIEHYKQGSRYEGEKVDNMKHGRGKFFYQDGGLYDGQWVRNRMQGKGKLYYQSGKLAYDGQWQNDMFYGEGTLFNEYPKALSGAFDYSDLDLVEDYWTKVKGHFKEDCKQGKCTLYLQNGEYFEGSYDGDLATGPGVFQALDGRKIKGIWSKNKLISQDP